jgi:hypothetical protein
MLVMARIAVQHQYLVLRPASLANGVHLEPCKWMLIGAGMGFQAAGAERKALAANVS